MHARALSRHMKQRALAVVVLLALALPASVVIAGRRANQRFLARILAVDGPGSGIDADTVHGLTPDQMRAQVPPAISRAALYAHSRRLTLATGESQHLYADCDPRRPRRSSRRRCAVSRCVPSGV